MTRTRATTPRRRRSREWMRIVGVVVLAAGSGLLAAHFAPLALDEFVLWVNADTPYKTAQDYVNAIKSGQPGQFKLAGTWTKQENQIIPVTLEKAIGKQMTDIPFT